LVDLVELLCINIHLGISDSLLKQSRSGGFIEESVTTSGPGLGTKLCPLLMKVLFEIWLRSTTKNQVLWDTLKELVQGWRYRRPVLEHWSNTAIGLTNRLIRILYGLEEGTEVTTIHSNVYVDCEITLRKRNFPVAFWGDSVTLFSRIGQY
jgi:hypothetical protein